MIDYLKLRVTDSDLIRYIKYKPSLKQVQKIQYITHFKGFEHDIKTKDVYDYKGIVFCFYLDRLEILFKPHYYLNKGEHNGNDFNISNCINIINEIIIEFDLSAQKAKIMQLEFGLNFIPPKEFTPQQVIDYAEYHEKNKSISKYTYEKRFQKIGFKHGRYIYNTFKIIKFYWKGNQFNHLPEVNTNTLRFEIKSNKTTYINKLGIMFIEDLTESNLYLQLSDSLKSEFKQVLFLIDDVNSAMLTHIEKNNLDKYLRSQFWSKLITNTKDRNAFSRHKAKYQNILEKTGANLNAHLLEIITIKLNQLLEGSANFNQKKDNNIDDDYNLLSADLNIIKDKTCTNICLITGLDISMQKENSLLLSHTGLKHYHKYDYLVFENLKNKFLSEKWKFTDLDVQIKEIAHNIRNYKNNTKLKQIRIYPNQQTNFLGVFFNQLP
ncbi:hypothetical protein [Sphingobacterium rhinopitheci]|uniref:hypothetical protein n=1 Tax=Sphingobacterium rhinopitheci TaxID=2781960 RepID=UPI001F522E0C|nr:hypothetical protein [Sphingobacterium rhinopitheci]MCI0922518.1 hypothetical protein [Sphingobacterium rhinopitheci]